jgi:hypothetical protein
MIYVSKPVWHTTLLCVQWKTPDDGQRNFPNHVEFYSKNKFEKLVHLVGYIIRIYHSAQSPEHHIVSLLGFLDCTKMICRLCMGLSSSCCIFSSYQAHNRSYFQQYLFEYGKLCTKSSRHFSRRIYKQVCLFPHYYQLLFHHQVAL